MTWTLKKISLLLGSRVLGNIFIHEILLKVWFSFSLSVDNCIILIGCFGKTLWGFRLIVLGLEVFLGFGFFTS